MDGYGTSSSANMVTGLDREALWGLMTQTSGTGERRLAGGWDQSQRAYLVHLASFYFSRTHVSLQKFHPLPWLLHHMYHRRKIHVCSSAVGQYLKIGN